MRKSILILLSLTLFISCKENKKSNPLKTESISKQIEKANETELLVQKILDLPDLQWIYHPDLKERLPVKVLETKQIDKSFNLKKFGQKVRILTLAQLKKEEIKDYVVFNKLEIKNDTTYFELYYKIEGAGSVGKLVKVNGEWTILDYSVAEN